MSKRNSLILLLNILSFYLAFAQEFNTLVYTQDDGLPDNYIYSISRTHNGYLWVGTSGGLARFDGHSFETIEASDSLNNYFVTSLFADETGCFWIGHNDGFISKIKQNKTQTQALKFDDLSKVCSITKLKFRR